MAKYDQTNSIIGEGSVFEGKFYVNGTIKIDGKFEGDIRTKDSLQVGNTGKIKTNIEAREVVLAGTMIGDINASEEVHLTETGRLMGDINAPVVNIANGVVLKGSVNITGGKNKEAQKLIEDSFHSGNKKK